MRLTARGLVVAGALIVAVIGLALPAQAGPGDFVNCEQHPTAPECLVDPRTPGAPGRGGGGGGGSAECRNWQGQVVPCSIPGKGWYGGDGCWYRPATGNDLALAEALGGKPIPPGQWYVGSCGDPLTNWWPTGYIKYRVFGPDGPSAEVLADEAVKRLRLPAPIIRMNPVVKLDPTKPPAQVVYVPTWFWVESTSWGSRSATASAGGLSVTATAKPVTVVWSTGDGASETCAGPGTPWTSDMDPAKPSPTCGHTYANPSGDGSYSVRATVTWEISWAGGGESGTRPPLTTTASVDLRVLEAGGLNTNGTG
jgi:hypothetical protein